MKLSNFLLILALVAILVVSGCTSNLTKSSTEPNSSNINQESNAKYPSKIISPIGGIELTKIDFDGDASKRWKMKFLEHQAYKAKDGSIFIVGKIKNDAGEGIKMMGVKATFYDKNNNIVMITTQIDSSVDVIEDLKAGETKDFEVTFPARQSAKAVKYYLDIDWDIFIPANDEVITTSTPAPSLSNVLTNRTPSSIIVYDDFSLGVLDSSKWIEEIRGTVSEKLVSQTEGVYHVLQNTTDGYTVLLTAIRKLKIGEALKFDLDYKEGKDAVIYFKINGQDINGLVAMEDNGLHKLSFYFNQNKIISTVKKADGTTTEREIPISSNEFTFSIVIGQNTPQSTIHTDYDNFIIEVYE